MSLVEINIDRCIGCTRCMRVCPTESIRIKNKKVHLLNDRCIYCGNCIENCHKSAYQIRSDTFANLNKYKVNIAILPISSYGLVSSFDDLTNLYQTLYDFGFNEVFDLSIVTHLLSDQLEYILKDTENKPYILTQCPSVIRLIQIKYPTLMENILPFDFPFEIGAKIALAIYKEKYQLDESEIGISYISECLSNFIAIKEPIGKNKSNVDNVFLFSDIFKSILNNLGKKPVINNISVSKKGIQYAKVGAIQRTTDIKEYISVDGINNVDDILEKIYLGVFPKVKIIEAYSCVGGCVGGNFTLENTFVSKWKINHFSQSLDDEESKKYVKDYKNRIDNNDWYFKEMINSSETFKLSENIILSIKKMNKINQILNKLPKIDCCACGSPSCRALAEDIVNLDKTINDCIVLKGLKGENIEN
jgi:Na+-translocating ferredoxin:NAD+ oxidoreductase RNF subunit RnfB